MASIEVITSTERQVTRKDESGNKFSVTVLVWNATVRAARPMHLVDSLRSCLQREGSQGVPCNPHYDT